MPIAIWYWLLMFIWLIFGWWGIYTPGQPYPYKWGGGVLICFLLFLIIGLHDFGSPIK